MATNTDEREEIKPVAPTEQTKWRDPSLVGKYMVDPKTGLAGLFRSPNNGETWILTDTVYGHVYNQDEVDNIWDNGAAHKVADEIKSATADLPNVRKQADEAVKFAESAIAASKVNSDAIVAQSEAISEAKTAMDSATAEIQQTAANAASDAAKIRADVARVQNEVDTAKAANSASVEALKSDVSAAKQDLSDVHDSLDKAQSAIEQNQKLINDSVTKITSDVSATKQDLANVHDSLTKAQAAAEQNQKAINDSIAQINANVDATNQDLAGVRKDLAKAQSDITANQKAIDDNVAQINADITQDRKDIASAQQANADTAKQLDTYSKQATEQGKTIKSIQDKQDGFTATIADVQGNVTQVSDKVDGLSASLKDAQDNVASVKAQADQLSATLTDHAKSIATLTASAKELSSTLEDADGRLSKVEQTAQTNSSTLSDVQGDLSQVKQDATTLTATLKDAQGNISTLQQKADSVSAQLASAQGDIATLQTGVDGVKATLTSHDKSIHTLQADSKSLKDSMVNAQGDISTLRKTATDVTSELEDHTGRLSKVEQSAAKQATTLSDLQGNLSQVEQKADSNTATISSISKNAMQDRGVITDTKTSFDSLTQLGTYSIKASGLPKMPEQHYGTLVVSGSAGSGWLSQQFVADTTGNVYTRVFSNNAWSAWKQGGSQDAINQVKQTADSNSATIRNVQGDVSTLKQTATGIKSTLASHEGDIHTLQVDSKSLKDSMTNAQGDISTLQKSATSLDSEMKDHAGRLIKVEQSAATQATTLSDLQGNLSQVKQQADGLVTTLKSAQGDITQIQQKADGTLAQLKSAQGDIASLQTDVTGIKATLTSHEGDIHTLQADSKTLKDGMADAQGNISSLQKTATSLNSEISSQDGRLSKVEQTATEHTSELADTKGNIDSLKQRADSLQVLLGTAQQDINNIKINASGLDAKLTTQGNDINQIKANAAGMSTRLSGVETAGNQLRDQLNGLKIGTSNLLHHSDTFDGWYKGDSVNISSTKYLNGNIAVLKNAGSGSNMLNTNLDGPYDNQPVTWTVYAKADNVGDKFHTELWGGGGITDQALTTEWQSYKFTGQRDARNHAFYLWGCQGNKGNVYVALPFAVIGNTIGSWSPNNTDVADKITTNTVEINATKKMVEVKADKSEVDNVKGTVNQVSAEQKTMADQINQKVSSVEYQTLKDKVNGMKIGTRNLLHHSDTFDGWYKGDSVNISSTKYLNGNIAVLKNAGSGSNMLNTNLDGPYDNQPVTWTVYAKADNVGDKFHTELWGGGGITDQALTTEWQSYKFTGQRDARNHAFYLWGCVGNKGNIYVALPFAVVGNYIGTWSPNPEDTIAAIQKNSTAIDQTDQKISLKADQTEVDKVKNTASQNSSRLDVMAGQISSKVTATDVNNIVDKKGYATTSTVQSLITQKAGTINESITRLDSKYNTTVTQVQSLTASIDGLQSRVTNYQNDTSSKYTQLSNLMQSKVNQGDLSSVRTQLANAINDRVGKGELMSQINLQAGNTLIQSNKLYLDASSVVFSGRAFIPSAAIASLSADKVNTGTLNTNDVSLGDGRTRIRADHDYMYIQPTGSAASNTGIRMGYSGLDFLTNVIPNGYNSSVPYYSIGYDGASNGYLRISAFDHINPGGATATQNWFTMVDAISLTNSEINFATKGNMHMQVVDGGVNIKPTLFFQNNTNNGTWAGFTRGDNSDVVEFSTGDNNGENFRIDCGARFMQYVYINGNARAQQWLTNSALSKKMNIRKLDLQTALDKIRQDDQYLYEYKRNVAQGIHDPQASFIIDDVHDVAHYSVPREFIDNTGKYREPSVELAYLIAAFQAIDKQVQKQKEEIKELKEKLQHE